MREHSDQRVHSQSLAFGMTGSSRWVWLLAALFIGLGLGYDTFTPIFENSDEDLHYAYINHLADGKGLPVGQPNQLWGQEATQHPLYYAIAAVGTFWIDDSNHLDHLQRNPHWLFSDFRSLINDNQNQFLHGPQDEFPYRQTALAAHISRWISLFFGLVTVVCTFFIARHLFPDELPIAITATALVAFTPQFIRVATTVSNDSLSAALTSLAVLVALKLMEKSPPPPPKGREKDKIPPFGGLGGIRSATPYILGILCSLALLTKLSSLGVFILVSVILFEYLVRIPQFHRDTLHTFIVWMVIIGGVMALSTGWWFIRNFQLYGEWLATDIHLSLAGGHREISLVEVWGLRAEIERAYWATFGWGQIRPPEWVFDLLSRATRLSLVGLFLGGVAQRAQQSRFGYLSLNINAYQLNKLIFLLIWSGISLVLYTRWVMSVGSVSHTRLIFPAITAISLLLAIGWHTFIPRRFEIWFSGLVIVLFFSLNLYSLNGLLRPAFTPTPQSVALVQQTSLVDITFLDKLRLSKGGVELPDQTPPQRGTTVDDTILVNTVWQVREALDKNYSVAVSLVAPDGRALAQRETYPGLGLRPTQYLQANESFVDVYPLTLMEDVSEPMIAKVSITIFDFESEDRVSFPAVDAAGNIITPFIAEVKLNPTTPPQYIPETSTDVQFAGAITLIGYDLSQQNGNTTLTLYWAPQQTITENYAVFVHLLDETGEIINQADGPPTGDSYPTRWWQAGEVIADARNISDTGAVTTIHLGLYRAASGERLPITEADVPTQDHAVEIDVR